MANKYIVILDRGNSTERSAIHAIVKENSDGWWHQYADTWIVNGTSASRWRDLVKPALKPGPSSVMVIRLPDSDDRKWAYFGPKAEQRGKWLHSNYK